MPALAQFSENRKRRDFLATVAAFAHAYCRALARGLDKLTPGQRWQLACRLRKTWSKADRADADAAEICQHVVGTNNFWACIEHIETMCSIDERATRPKHTDSVVIPFAPILDRRAAIRASRSYQSQAGPPPPLNDDAPGWRPRAASAHCWAKSFGATSPRYALTAVCATPAARKSPAGRGRS
jgi:hypothetical protein